MKKLKFGIQVAIIMSSFPLLFIVGITHAAGNPSKESVIKEFEVAKIIPSEEEFVFTNSYMISPKPLN